ncbi:response regulator [Clostridium sp.]|uniref:response regulator transcription factor n=1 Tax=Clostridium sp. TaxID=1506 RepID=UPI0025B914F4|nr:response regulator [Clostridium sp.]
MSKNYCKVLIVEDEFIMRQGMKHMLEWEKEGFTIVGEATNGQEALDLIEKLKPNIIISDIVMPILNGVDFSKIVQKRYPDLQIIILSSYDNFEYVKDTLLSGAVDYILKPTLNPEQLLVTLKKAVDRIPGLELVKNEDIYYNKLIERYLLGFDSKLDVNKYLNLFPDTCFRILGINLKQSFGKNKESIKRIKRKVEEFFILNKNYAYLKLIINDEILLYIINYKVSNDKEIVDKIKTHIERNIFPQENILFIITPKFDNIFKVKDIYNEKFIPYLAQKFYYKSDFLLNTECIEIRSKIEKFDSNKYSNHIKSKEFNSAINMIKQYVDYAINSMMDEYKLKNLVKNLLYNVVVSLEPYDIETDELRQSYFKKIDSTAYSQDFLEEINNIILELKDIISKKINVEEERVKEILEYINEHYDEPLELSDISKAFNFNYYYLSFYFNTHCKEGFSEYLNRIRVEKSCELLKENKLYVSEISSIVGYSDHSYFCRVFKKIVGYTPSNYRRSNQIKGVLINEKESENK